MLLSPAQHPPVVTVSSSRTLKLFEKLPEQTLRTPVSNLTLFVRFQRLGTRDKVMMTLYCLTSFVRFQKLGTRDKVIMTLYCLTSFVRFQKLGTRYKAIMTLLFYCVTGECGHFDQTEMVHAHLRCSSGITLLSVSRVRTPHSPPLIFRDDRERERERTGKRETSPLRRICW